MPDNDSGPPESGGSRSLFTRLALPFTFNPELGPAGAFVAVLGSLARIFGSCLLLAGWGGLSAWVWSSIADRFWRMAAVGPLVLLFPGALIALFLAIGTVETKVKTRC